MATFTAVDPEGKSVTWSVVATDPGGTDLAADDFTDSALFKISKSGELTFMDPPDYEAPGGGGDNDSNTYMLVVAASDGVETAYKKVEVEVTNVEEDATTSIELSSLQPQISTPITVDYVDVVGNPLVNAGGGPNDAIVDPDQDKSDPSTTIPAEDVEWQWSKSSSRTGTYTDIPGDGAAKTSTYEPASQDRGMYLRVTATYEDGEGEGKTVVATSAYPVRAFPSGNSAPAFPTDFGPDPDDENVTLTAPMAEADDGATEGDDVGDPVEANDANNDRLTYSLEADGTGTAEDADVFQIDRMTGQVTVGLGKTVSPEGDTAEPASVTKDDMFTVTIKATDPSSLVAMVVMTITVDEVDEAPVFTAGKMSHSHAENTDAAEVVYPFVAYDPEAQDVTYSLSGADAGKFAITGGALTFDDSPNFEARGSADGDNVYELTVKAASTGTQDGATEKSTTVDVTVEVTNVDEPGTVTLSASQPRIGVEIRADTPVDPDGGVTGVTWQWSIADNAAFDTNDADIKDATNAGYTPVTADDGKFLRVTASYTDAEGEGKTADGMPATPNVMVVKVRNLAPAFTDEDDDTAGIQVDDREVAESAAANDNVGAVVVATDDDDAETDDDDSILYLLSGADAASFDIDSTGQIMVGASAKLDHETNPAYEVTVTARDLEGLSSSVDVTIKVTDVDEPPDISGPSSKMYAENGEGVVAVFTADDPEMKSVTWSVVADASVSTDIDVADVADSALFKISKSGELTFMDPPDYEAPGGGGDNDSNTYMLVVAASDGAEAEAKTAYKKVTVEVTNVEEDATTGIEMSSLQPQVSTAITVDYVDGVGNPLVNAGGGPNDAIVDPDQDKSDPSTTIPAGDVKWQWSKSSRRTGTYVDITGYDAAETATYTPASQDRGMYLRVTATYEDGEGEGKTVVATSMYPVRAFPSGNSAPAFPDDFNAEEDDDQLPMAEADDGATEGDDVGDPVEANDANDDRLTYSLEADGTGTAEDADVFQIDRMTGQVTVGLGKTVSPEGDTAEPASVTKDDMFTVTIKATDPSSLVAMVVMTITVDEVDEAPVFTAGKMSHSHAENTDAAEVVYPFVAYDPEAQDVTYSLSGADAGKFAITGGALTFDDSPNFEARGSADGDNVYELTVKAASTGTQDGATEKSTTVDVTVEVTNVDEPGTVTLSASQPRIGVEIRADTPVDPDGGVTGVTWQWSIADNAAFDTNDADIKDATNAGYTPVTADDGKFLRVTASYTDAEGEGKTADGMPATPNVMVEKVRNLAPVFTDEDTTDDAPGIQVDDREVAESAAANDNVGAVVAATDTADADGTDDNSILYLLSGAEAASFEINSGTGQITVGASAKLDHETNPAYQVTVTARDPEGLSSSVDVTIKVTDVNEAPKIMRAPDANVAPEFADSEDGARSVAEDTAAGEAIGNPVAASDANRDALTYALSGTDAASFDIDTGSGQLMTLAALDYETKATYSVTVTASDSGGLSDSIDVTITVTDVNEAPVAPTVANQTATKDTAFSYTVPAFTDPEGGTITYAATLSDDSALPGWLSFNASTRELSGTPLEADTPASPTIKVSATDDGSPSASAQVTFTLTVGEEAPTTLLVRYDGDKDGWIQLEEARVAVGDYFAPPKGEKLSLADTRKVVGLYFEYKNSQ